MKTSLLQHLKNSILDWYKSNIYFALSVSLHFAIVLFVISTSIAQYFLFGNTNSVNVQYIPYSETESGQAQLEQPTKPKEKPKKEEKKKTPEKPKPKTKDKPKKEEAIVPKAAVKELENSAEKVKDTISPKDRKQTKTKATVASKATSALKENTKEESTKDLASKNKDTQNTPVSATASNEDPPESSTNALSEGLDSLDALTVESVSSAKEPETPEYDIEDILNLSKEEVDELSDTIADNAIEDDNIIQDSISVPKVVEEDSDTPAGDLTAGEIDALKTQITSCWYYHGGYGVPVDLSIHLSMSPDGTIDKIAAEYAGNAPSSIDAAVVRQLERALRSDMCKNLKLPREKYSSWKEIKLNVNLK